MISQGGKTATQMQDVLASRFNFKVDPEK